MNSPNSTAPALSKYRWTICGLLFWVTTANYMDRGVFANLAPELQTKIGWTQDQYWYMQVVFQAAYAVSNILAGRLMDVMGLRWGFTLALHFLGTGRHEPFPGQHGRRLFHLPHPAGLGEGGNFPAANKANAEWFPKRERALSFASSEFRFKHRQHHRALLPAVADAVHGQHHDHGPYAGLARRLSNHRHF